MKKLAIAMSLYAIATGVFAADGNTSPHQVTGTVSVVSDYIFRGLTQTWHQPAVQGSIDYAHASGLFGSLWASTLSEKVVAGAHTEFDLMLGYKGASSEGFSYGAGVVAVYYPGGNWNKMKWGSRPDQKYDFAEANVSAGYKWVSLKYSRALTDLLGFNEKTGFNGGTKGSEYVEANADIPLGETGIILGLHAGREDFKADAGELDPDATDYRISLTRTFADNWVGAAQLTKNTNKAFFNGTRSNLDEGDLRDVGKARLAISLTRLF